MQGLLTGFLYTIHIISCLILIIVVLLHESKGDSLASVFGGGGSDSAFGVQFGKKVSRFTIGAASIFILLAIFLGIWLSKAPPVERITDTITTDQTQQLPVEPEQLPE